MTVQLGLVYGAPGFLADHPTAGPVLVLTAIFLFGCLEAAVLKQRDWACGTWFLGLMGLTGWIVYPLTTVHICLGVIAFVPGVILMILYSRRWGPFS